MCKHLVNSCVTYSRLITGPDCFLLARPGFCSSCSLIEFCYACGMRGPPLWSSGQSFWLQIQRSRVRFPALPDFLSSSGSGTGSTQPREFNWGATWIKSSGSGLENRDSTAVGNRYADHVTPLYPQKLALTSPSGGGRSVGMVRSRTEATEFSFSFSALVGQ